MLFLCLLASMVDLRGSSTMLSSTNSCLISSSTSFLCRNTHVLCVLKFFVYLLLLCLCTCAWYMCVRVWACTHHSGGGGGQRITWVRSLLSLCGFQRSNSSCQVWWQHSLQGAVSPPVYRLSLNCIPLLDLYGSSVYKLRHLQNKLGLRLFAFWSYVEVIDMITWGWTFNPVMSPCISGIVLDLWHICNSQISLCEEVSNGQMFHRTILEHESHELTKLSPSFVFFFFPLMWCWRLNTEPHTCQESSVWLSYTPTSIFLE